MRERFVVTPSNEAAARQGPVGVLERQAIRKAVRATLHAERMATDYLRFIAATALQQAPQLNMLASPKMKVRSGFLYVCRLEVGWPARADAFCHALERNCRAAVKTHTGVAAMRRSIARPIRNSSTSPIAVQMRLVRKRLGLSDAELTAIAGRIANSIAAISKEAPASRQCDAPTGPTCRRSGDRSATATEPAATEMDAARRAGIAT